MVIEIILLKTIHNIGNVIKSNYLCNAPLGYFTIIEGVS